MVASQGEGFCLGAGKLAPSTNGHLVSVSVRGVVMAQGEGFCLGAGKLAPSTNRHLVPFALRGVAVLMETERQTLKSHSEGNTPKVKL